LSVRLTPKGGADRIAGWAEDAAGRRLLKARGRASRLKTLETVRGDLEMLA